MNCCSLSPAMCPIPLVRVLTGNVLFPMLFYTIIFHALCLILTRGLDKLPWETETCICFTMHQLKNSCICILALKLESKNFPEPYKIFYTYFLVTAFSLIWAQSSKWAREGNELKHYAVLPGPLSSRKHLLAFVQWGNVTAKFCWTQVCHLPELNSESRDLILESWVVLMHGRS